MNLGRIREIIHNRGITNSFVHALRQIAARKEKLLFGPDLIRLNPVGYLCNHDCPMCWRDQLTQVEKKELVRLDREERLSISDYLKLFRDMPAGLREVNVVGGGEPLLYPDIAALMEEIKRFGWRGSLITNGTLLSEKIIHKMLKVQWEVLRVSVSAGDRDTYQQIQGVDTYEILLENLANFIWLRDRYELKKRCKLVIFHVIQRVNISSIDRLFRMAVDVNADAIEFDPIIPLNPDDLLTDDERKRAVDTINRMRNQFKIPFNHSEIVRQLTTRDQQNGPFIPAKYCSVGYDQAFIQANGNVLPCCFSDEVMGNLKNESFQVIWWKKEFQDFRCRLIHGQFARYCIEKRCMLPSVLHH